MEPTSSRGADEVGGVLRQAADAVARDIAATSDVALRFEVESLVHEDGAFVRISTSAGTIRETRPWDMAPAELVALVADHVQEDVIEELWSRGSNWPVCPAHPATHPMEATVVNGVASWCCPVDGTVKAAVGSLIL